MIKFINESECCSNPIEFLRKDYDNIIIAHHEDYFFASMEDIAVCAEANNEDIVSTMNKIIDLNEGSGLNSNNFVLQYTDESDMNMVSELQNAGVLMEEVKFSFLPKFARDPNLSKYVSELKDAENLCKAGEVDNKTSALKAFRLASRMLSIASEVNKIAALATPFKSIIHPVGILVNAGVGWALANGEENLAKAEGKKVLERMNMMIARESNPEVKEQLTKKRDSLQAAMKRVNPVIG